MADDMGADYTLPEGALDSSPTITPHTPAPSAPQAGTYPGEGQPAQDNRVPYDRFQTVNTKWREAERIAAESRAETEILRRQIQALTGVQQQSQDDPQEAAIRAALFKVMPQLKHLEKLPFDRLTEMLDAVPQLQATQQAQYDQLADTMLGTLYREAQATFGADALNEDQRSFLHASFVRWMETNPQQLQRYSMRDPGVVSTFLQNFTSKMLDPVRRQAAVNVGARAARTAMMPTSGSASGPIGTAPPALPPGDEDARHDAAWNAFRAKLGG